MKAISSVTELTSSWSGHQVVMPEAIAAVEDIMKENRHETVNKIAAHLDMSTPYCL
jgi:hypothetical protein